MQVTDSELINAVKQLLGKGCYVNKKTVSEDEISADNFSEIFLIKPPSQIEIDEERYTDHSISVSYNEAYNQVMRLRRKEAYGSWEEQLEMQFDGTWNDHVQEVKNTYPFI